MTTRLFPAGRALLAALVLTAFAGAQASAQVIVKKASGDDSKVAVTVIKSGGKVEYSADSAEELQKVLPEGFLEKYPFVLERIGGKAEKKQVAAPKAPVGVQGSITMIGPDGKKKTIDLSDRMKFNGAEIPKAVKGVIIKTLEGKAPKAPKAPKAAEAGSPGAPRVIINGHEMKIEAGGKKAKASTPTDSKDVKIRALRIQLARLAAQIEALEKE